MKTYVLPLEFFNRNRRKIWFFAISIICIIIFVLQKKYQFNITGFKSKTFWDWMELLIIPVGLAFIVGILNKSEREQDRNRENERFLENSLQHYFDKMTDLLKEELASSDEKSTLRTVAISRTASIIKSLDNKRINAVFEFLRFSKLNVEDTKIVDFDGVQFIKADLGGVYLNYANLNGTHFMKGNFKKSIFFKCYFKGAVLNGSDFTKAKLHESHFESSHLKRATFRNADLNKTHFNGADLRGAQFDGADLRGADFTGALFKGLDFDNSKEVEATFRATEIDDETIGIPEYLLKNAIR